MKSFSKFILYIFIFLLMMPSFAFFLNIENINFSDFSELLFELKTPLLNTILYCLAVTFISVILGTSLFWLVNFHQFRFVTFWKYILFLPTLIPIYIAAFADAHFFEYSNFMVKLFPKLQFKNYIGATVVASLSLYPYIYIIMESIFKKVQNAITVSRLHGYSSWKIYWQVMFSSGRPTIIFATSLISMEVIAEYGMSNHFGLNNLSNFLYRKWFYAHQYHYASMAGIVVFGIIAILLIFEERTRQQANYSANIHNNNINKFKLSLIQSFLVNLYCLFIATFAVFIPIGELIYLASNKFSEIFYTKESILNILKLKEYGIFSLNTVYIGSIIAILSIILGYLINYLFLSKYKKLNSMLKGMVTFAYGIPGAFIAISLIIWLEKVSNFVGLFSVEIAQWIKYSFFGTTIGIIYGSVFRFSNIAIYTLNSGLVAQKKEMTLVKKIFSSDGVFSKLKTFFWCLPLHFKEIIVVFLVVFIDSIKELPITLILRPFNFTNLSIKTYDFISDEKYEEASIPALILIVILMIVTWICMKIMKRTV